MMMMVHSQRSSVNDFNQINCPGDKHGGVKCWWNILSSDTKYQRHGADDQGLEQTGDAWTVWRARSKVLVMWLIEMRDNTRHYLGSSSVWLSHADTNITTDNVNLNGLLITPPTLIFNSCLQLIVAKIRWLCLSLAVVTRCSHVADWTWK